jgi:hypothetical protein
MPSNTQTQIGPKTAYIPCPRIVTSFGVETVENSVTLNDAPRAGQAWDLSSVTYRFPNAFHDNKGLVVGAALEFIFGIEMIKGAVQIATQEILESGVSANETKEFPMHLIGALEPFVPTRVFAGEGLNFNYKVATKMKNGIIDTGTGGFIAVTYDLVY